ncbi:MAG: hypothetical protein R2844_16925 [Caldilineales bacterium]
MNLNDFRSFTDALTANLAGDARVLGLVALGSMAELDYLPDEWSDHDFFVVTEAGAQEALLADLSWLPRSDRLVYVAPEGAHGFRAIFDDGHLVEPVVLDVDELESMRIIRYRMLLDRADIGERMAAVAVRSAAESTATDDRVDIGMFLVNLAVGAGRFRRGERLSGHLFVKSYATEHLLRLLARYLTPERPELLDTLAPSRRFELLFPAVAAELDEIENLPPVDGALRLLDLAERELAGRMADFPGWRLRRSGTGCCGRPVLTLPVHQPASKRLVGADDVLPRPVAQQFLVAHGDHVVQLRRPQADRVVAVHVQRVVNQGRQLLQFVGTQHRQHRARQHGLMYKDRVAHVLIVEGSELRQAIQPVEVVAPALQQAAPGIDHQHPGVEVGPQHPPIHRGSHRENVRRRNLAAFVDQRPERVEGFVEWGADHRVVHRPVAQRLACRQQQRARFVQEQRAAVGPDQQRVIRAASCSASAAA